MAPATDRETQQLLQAIDAWCQTHKNVPGYQEIDQKLQAIAADVSTPATPGDGDLTPGQKAARGAISATPNDQAQAQPQQGGPAQSFADALTRAKAMSAGQQPGDNTPSSASGNNSLAADQRRRRRGAATRGGH